MKTLIYVEIKNKFNNYFIEEFVKKFFFFFIVL